MQTIENVPVAKLMQSGFSITSPDMPFDRFIEDYFLHRDQRGFPVSENERLVGMVCLEDIRKIERSA
jgi:predicted transcriptional regulator